MISVASGCGIAFYLLEVTMPMGPPVLAAENPLAETTNLGVRGSNPFGRAERKLQQSFALTNDITVS
jgi:hypothetical protein